MAFDQTSPVDLPEYHREVPTQECKDIIASLPSHRAWLHNELHLYQGFWYHTSFIGGIVEFQKHFEARDSDVLLGSSMKTGTTWMKALIFAIMNRRRFLNFQDHPLLHNNPHSLVPNMELQIYGRKDGVDLSLLQSPRLFATHTAFISLPTSLKDSNCKIVYIGRNPKDTFVSLWHFLNKLKNENLKMISLETAFDMFCKGVSSSGPVWEHALSYWKESLKRPHKILFLKFEELKENPLTQTRRLANFLDFPISDEEEKQGVVDDILELCSFKHLSQLGVNKDGKSRGGIEYSAFFRKGEVGDWKNCLTPTMADKIDKIIAGKLSGTGLDM